MNEEIELRKRLQIIGRFTDIYLGNFLLDNEKFKVSVSKKDGNGSNIKFAKFNDEYPDGSWNTYNYRDTIFLNKRYFQIDTLLQNPTLLVLKPLNIKEQTYGYIEGAILNNYSVEDLKGNNVFLKKIASKKLLLLDFWGTWCAPCMELTPNLKELNNKYKSKLNIVSLAYQENVKPVEEYVAKNNLNWFNGIILKGNPKSFYEKRKIIRELRVKSFPTFILVDKDFKIVYRTYGGGENFEKLVDFIDKY
jgi:thiol-disulfide isomerase/thioredoxin